MFHYGIIDMLLDVTLFGGDSRPPNRLRAAFTPNEVGRLVDGTLEHLMNPGLPIMASKADPLRESYKNSMGKASWKQLEAEVERVRDIVKELTQGYSVSEIEQLYHAIDAKQLIAEYSLLANHAVSKQDGSETLRKTISEIKPEIKRRLDGFMREGVEHGTFEQVLKHAIADESALDIALIARNRSQSTVRNVNQAMGTAFSSLRNLKTSIGSAANITHDFDTSILFYSGAAGMAHVAYQAFQPKKDDTPGNENRHTWKGLAVESAASLGAMAIAVITAGRRIAFP